MAGLRQKPEMRRWRGNYLFGWKTSEEVLYQTPPKIAATLLAIFELTQGVRMGTGIFDITKLSAAMIGRERCNQIN